MEQKNKPMARGSNGAAADLAAKKELSVPVLGDASASLIPAEDQNAFLAFASRRPRIMEILAKPELNDGDREALGAAYAAYKEEKVVTALVKVESVSLAPVIGIPEDEVTGLLEVYRPAKLRELVVVAQREGVEARDLILIDAALLEDGSYIGREQETVAVSAVHSRLTKLVNDELKRHAKQHAVRAEDTNLDTLWDRLVQKHGGDEAEAAEEYKRAAAEILTRATKKTTDAEKFELNRDLVVELFKLFNYEKDEIYAFLEYVEHNLDLGKKKQAVKDVENLIFDDLLEEYVEERAKELVLNERSNLYARARAIQLGALVEKGEIVETSQDDTEDADDDGMHEEEPENDNAN